MSPGSAGLSVRKTARYAGEYRGSLHAIATKCDVDYDGGWATSCDLRQQISDDLALLTRIRDGGRKPSR